MDIGTFCALLAAIYPPIKDGITYVINNKGAISQGEFRNQIREMVTVVQSDISSLKSQIEEIRDITARLNIDTEQRGVALWHLPHGVNAIYAWRYKRVVKKINNLAEQFRTSMDGIIDVIACCAGIMEGIPSPMETERAPTWATDLNRNYEDLLDKGSVSI
jgi:hypothetical protein